MKKKLVTRLLSAALIGGMLAGMLTGCGSSSSSSEGSTASSAEESGSSDDVDLSEIEAIADVGYDGDPIELTFWTLQTRQEGTDIVTEIFNEANPNINVTVSYYDTDGIKDACKTAAQSGSMPSFWFNWGGALGQYYVDNGVT
jgi:raffinose/stachyose/melibiose transport system substrate-binding protein